MIPLEKSCIFFEINPGDLRIPWEIPGDFIENCVGNLFLESLRIQRLDVVNCMVSRSENGQCWESHIYVYKCLLEAISIYLNSSE